MKLYLKVLKNYADFSGRADRKEYWMFILLNIIFSTIAVILDNAFAIAFKGMVYRPIYALYVLGIIVPGLAVSVRRLHDIGKSGWTYLIVLIPIVGPIWLLILMATDSESGDNEYESHAEKIADTAVFANQSTRDTAILIVVIWMLFSFLFWSLMPKFIDDYYLKGWFKPLQVILSLVWTLVPITLACIVKKKNKKIILFILGGAYLLYTIYDIVSRLFE